MNAEKGIIAIAFFMMGFVSVMVWRQNLPEHTQQLLIILGNTISAIAGYLAKDKLS